eukprot:PhF_6_TR19946/c1_g1_i2/m.29040
MAEASEIALSQRLRTLCEEYNNRPYIARRGVLPTLVKFLQNENHEVQMNAAETLRLLSEHPENPEPMCKEKGLLQALAAAYEATEEKDPEVFQVVAEIISNLESALEQRTARGPSVAPITEAESAMTSKNRGQRITQSVVGRTRTITLEIPTMSDANSASLVDLLECTRGVVSFTLDTVARTATLYTSTSTPTLLRLMEDKGFIAIVRSETNPQARQRRVSATPIQAPQYLSGSHEGSSEYLRSIVLHGVDGNSLSSRLERQKLEKAKNAKEKNAKQVGQLTGFFQKITSGWW